MGILIAICVLLLAAYAFDISASRTKVPAVILLLALGWGLRQATNWLQVSLPDMDSVLPVLGTIGLILIVLEGSLELDLTRSKLPMIGKATLLAILPLLLLAGLFSWLFSELFAVDFLIAFNNVLPLAIISSAIAIPTVRGFDDASREFVTYESSLSDIAGILIFNFVSLNNSFEAKVFGEFGLQILAIFGISFVATIGLAFLLSRIQHHVKFAPIVLLIILIYAIAKELHLPGLILIMAFGMFLGNLDRLVRFQWIKKLRPQVLEREVHKMKELISEGAFLMRALFFLLFGYSIQTSELINPDTFLWALGLSAAIYLIRALFLKILGMKLQPLLFIAPRGLITVLLFISLPASRSLPFFNNSLIIQVVLITSVMIMVGTISQSNRKPSPVIDFPLPSDSTPAADPHASNESLETQDESSSTDEPTALEENDPDGLATEGMDPSQA